MANRFVLKLASMVYRPQRSKGENAVGIDIEGMERALGEILKKK